MKGRSPSRGGLKLGFLRWKVARALEVFRLRVCTGRDWQSPATNHLT